MKERRRNKNQRGAGTPPAVPLSRSKKRLFWAVTLFSPFVLLVALEAGLRLFQYGGNLSLFIDGPPGYGEYLQCNPNVGRRYFYVQSDPPTLPTQLLLRKKPANGYRLFVLGASSAAGFPYGNNASFPNILARGLSRAFPERNIEVVNISMSAVNSYALLDLLDEVLAQSPDALLVYAGHNEYYGALGVGSIVSLGRSPWIVRTYLTLQSFKIFLLLRSMMGSAKYFLDHLLYHGSEADPSSTLMEKIVGEQTIPYGSDLYEAGKEQFRENLEAILRKASGKGVRVVLSELVSNLRDQRPFISVQDAGGNSADSSFDLARQCESRGDTAMAREDYIRAKDLDALRFRAPEDFNAIIRELAERYEEPLVPMVSVFERASPRGLIGGHLILEHLHPNRDGYFLMAEAFYETMRVNRMISEEWPGDSISCERNRGFTALDSVTASLIVRRLKGSWPFQPKSVPNRFLSDFHPANKTEEIAFHVLQHSRFNLEAGHMELGMFFEKQGEPEKAIAEYEALIASIPQESEFYEKAATVLLREKDYGRADPLLRASLKYRENSFANQWLGQIALIHDNFQEAVGFLKKADTGSPQVLFNLSRALYFERRWEEGDGYFRKLQELAPKSDYVAYLTRLRVLLTMKGEAPRPN